MGGLSPGGPCVTCFCWKYVPRFFLTIVRTTNSTPSLFLPDIFRDLKNLDLRFVLLGLSRTFKTKTKKNSWQKSSPNLKSGCVVFIIVVFHIYSPYIPTGILTINYFHLWCLYNFQCLPSWAVQYRLYFSRKIAALNLNSLTEYHHTEKSSITQKNLQSGNGQWGLFPQAASDRFAFWRRDNPKPHPSVLDRRPIIRASKKATRKIRKLPVMKDIGKDIGPRMTLCSHQLAKMEPLGPGSTSPPPPNLGKLPLTSVSIHPWWFRKSCVSASGAILDHPLKSP